MSQPTRVESIEDYRSPASLISSPRLRAADLLGKIVFVSLLCLIAFTAIPYGTAEAWWKAFFVCSVFTLCILWLIEGLLSRAWFQGIGDSWRIVLPVLILALFSFLQTVHLGRDATPETIARAIAQPTWNAISADPYQTRFFVLQLLGLALAGVLLLRYASSERRLRTVINVVIAVAVASAVFGILRQTTQHSPGFGLPLIAPEQGYGQFVNRNHFAFLMEMAFGLAFGLILAGGVRREQALIYFAALLPLWTALVLCGSRGGLIAMLAQLITAVLLFGSVARIESSKPTNSKALNFIRSRPARWGMLVTLICGVLLGTLWMGGDQLATRIASTSSEFETSRESREGVRRNEVWSTTWRMFAAHPILGVGMGAYWASVPEFHDASGSMTPQEAHNDYLELLASGGLVGVAIGVWFAIALFRATRENLRSAHRFRRAACFGASIAIAGVAVHSLVDFGLHMIANALVFTTLVVIAASKPRGADEPARSHA
ncbi:MAG: O-antigen ligase family protein [Pyrinomonadaceae bacterium]|nr:O-antigen ligase family protein [Pyrinomonadaceae bacterium]